MRILTLLLILAGQIAWSHGEHTAGPNGGIITMPAAFHVELVPQGARKFKIYLLDMEFKNPTLKDSSLEIKLGAEKVPCAEKKDHYVCTLPKTKKGELSVQATREKQKGNVATYEVPFKVKH